jgi:DNA polymerase-3 subunit epsilon
MDRIVVIDFETTGLSADGGDRVIEVGAVEINNGSITRHFSSLMNPGVQVPHFITELTGISDAMVRSAPPTAQVMRELHDFVGRATLVAHNAHFDRSFYQQEMARQRLWNAAPFLCTVRIARRVYPKSPNHQLKTLAEYVDIPPEGAFHRALSDAMLTARLFITMCSDIRARHRIEEIPLSLLEKLQKVTIAEADAWLAKCALR